MRAGYLALAGVRALTGLVVKAALVLALGAGPATYRAQVERPPDYRGDVVRYAPGRMGRTADIRGIARAPHMAAFTYARDTDMGRLWLHIAGPAGAADFLVVDLPRPGKDKANLIKRGVIAELDYASGVLICGKGWTGRAVECPVEVWVLK